MKFLVTGANGWIGKQVCSRLRDSGNYVLAADLVASPGPWDEFLEIDICNPDSLQLDEPNETIECLIHCAGYAHRPRETAEEIQKFHSINVDGTRNVIDWCKRERIHRILYVSSISVYDWNQFNQLPLDEEAPVGFETEYARTKYLGEKVVNESGIDGRIVRLATVFGEGDKANFAKLANAMKSRRFIQPGKGTARKSVISIDVASDMICRFAQLPNPNYTLINLGFPSIPTLAEICRAFSEECKFPQAPMLPLPILKTLAIFGDVVIKFVPSFPLNSMNVNKLTRSTCVSCKRALELFPDLQASNFRDSLRRHRSYYSDL